VAELELLDLVANRTMSPEIAATLQAAAQQRRSLLVVAIPRGAGKSTVTNATLEHVPEGTALHTLLNHPGDLDALLGEPAEGYLVVPEVSEAAVPGYIWGEPVRRVFAALELGYAFATALHAPGLDQAFAVLAQSNGVPDEHASRIDLMVYIRSLGDDWRAPTRRAIAEVHEIGRVTDGRPQARLLHRWDEADDRFEQISVPQSFDAGNVSLQQLADAFRAAADEYR
jgi:hypothetical protein